MSEDKRILLIDDEEVITFGFSAVLREPGVAVDCAQTLEHAKQLITANQYDAATVDLRLSNSVEVEGFECIRLLQASQRNCKIIVLTAYGGNGYREGAVALGVDRFFEKPMEPMVIRDVLKGFGVYGD